MNELNEARRTIASILRNGLLSNCKNSSAFYMTWLYELITGEDCFTADDDEFLKSLPS